MFEVTVGCYGEAVRAWTREEMEGDLAFAFGDLSE